MFRTLLIHHQGIHQWLHETVTKQYFDHFCMWENWWASSV